MNVKLARSGSGHFYKKLAVSADGKLAFITINPENIAGISTDLWVVRIGSGQQSVRSLLSFRRERARHVCTGPFC